MQMVQRGSQTVHHVFDLQAWLAEIKQQAEPLAGHTLPRNRKAGSALAETAGAS